MLRIVMDEGMFCLLLIVFCVAERFAAIAVIRRLDTPGDPLSKEYTTFRRLLIGFVFRLTFAIVIALAMNYFLGVYDGYETCIVSAAAIWLAVNLFMGVVLDAVRNRRRPVPHIDPSRICCYCGGIIDEGYDFCKVCGAKLKI